MSNANPDQAGMAAFCARPHDFLRHVEQEQRPLQLIRDGKAIAIVIPVIDIETLGNKK